MVRATYNSFCLSIALTYRHWTAVGRLFYSALANVPVYVSYVTESITFENISSNTTILIPGVPREYSVLSILTDDQLRRAVFNSVESVFADEETKEWLRSDVEARLGGAA